jgi:type II secretory pathway pseudopilin PulG
MPESSPLPPPPARKTRPGAGFTLIELLVVVGVIVLMMGLAIPAFNAIRGGTDFNSAIYDITGALAEGRAYAMANSTYVLVGFSEVSASQNASATPQVSGTGRLAIAIIASRDGTRPYAPLVNTPLFTGSNYLTFPSPIGYGSGTQYTPVTKLTVLTNVHMVDLQSDSAQEPTTGGMVRPWHSDLQNGAGWQNWENYCLGDKTACTAANCFLWPLGAAAGGSLPAQYVFTQVIEFDPQGTARLMVGNDTSGTPVAQDSIPYFIEIGIEPSNGSGAASPPAIEDAARGQGPGQIAAIQVDGITGAARTYRP